MSRRTFLPYAAGLALAVTLTGCAAESAAPEPTTPVPTPAAPSSSVATSAPAAPAASPTSAAPDFPEGLPPAAKKHTKDGAKAFVTFFISELNASWKRPDAVRIAELCRAKVSKSCAAFIRTATDLESKGHRYASDAVSIDTVNSLGEVDGLMRFDVRGRQERAEVVDSRGRVVLTDPREQSHFLVFLDWTRTGWILHDLKPFGR